MCWGYKTKTIFIYTFPENIVWRYVYVPINFHDDEKTQVLQNELIKQFDGAKKINGHSDERNFQVITQRSQCTLLDSI